MSCCQQQSLAQLLTMAERRTAQLRLLLCWQLGQLVCCCQMRKEQVLLLQLVLLSHCWQAEMS